LAALISDSAAPDEAIAIINISSGTIEGKVGDFSDTDALAARAEYLVAGGPIFRVGFSPDELTIRIRAIRPLEVRGRIARIVVLARVSSVNHVIGPSGFHFWLALISVVVLPFMGVQRLASRHSFELMQLAKRARQLHEGELADKDSQTVSSEVQYMVRSIEHLRGFYLGELEAAKDSYALIDSVLGLIGDGIIVVDEHGVVTLINGKAATLFQAGQRDALGNSLAKVVYSHQILEYWREASATGERRSGEFLPREGNRKLAVAVQPFTLKAGKFAIVVVQDVTRQRELETIRRDFISNLTHELRTPIASIKALSETLQAGALDDTDAARRFLDRIDVEVDALHQMVAELLDLSRLESGRESFSFALASPCDLAKSVVERLQPQALRAGLRLEFHCQAVPSVLLDQKRVEQVLVNLIHNAIKFTEPGGKIEVWIKPVEGDVEFSVIDTGVGIPKADLTRVFERFYKSDASRSEGGSGLGLAIARHVVEGHGGRIWVASEEGRGATFTFRLPGSDRGGR
jgi:two-component system phosphate regulon sensor histidine kinase PhoR